MAHYFTKLMPPRMKARSKGTCRQGQRADETGCTPASGGSPGSNEANQAEHSSRYRRFVAKVSRFLDRLPGGRWLRRKAAELKDRLVRRYGPKIALSVIASGQAISWGAFGAGLAAGIPIWIPSAVATAPAAALAELHYQLRGKYREKPEAPADPKVQKLAEEAVAELERDWDNQQAHKTLRRWRKDLELLAKELAEDYDYLAKGRGQPCEQGETATRSGCIPHSGEGASAPAKAPDEPIHKRRAVKPKKMVTAKWQVEKDAKGKVVKRQLILSNGQTPPVHLEAVPKTWSKIKVSLDPDADVWATGELRTRGGGRRGATCYNPKFTAENADAKWYRTREGLGKMEQMREQIKQALRSDEEHIREAAAAAWLMQVQGTRPGSEKDTKGWERLYGQPLSKDNFVVDKTKRLLKSGPRKGQEVTDVKVRLRLGDELVPLKDERTVAEVVRRLEAGEPLYDSTFWLKSHGATTLEPRHLVEREDGLHLEFMGKESIWNNHKVRDPELAAELRRRAKKAGEGNQLFPIDEVTVREFVGSLDGGDFTSKDLRTQRACKEAIGLMDKAAPPTSQAEYDQRVREVCTEVSKLLGNTPVMAYTSYIDPVLFRSKWPGFQRTDEKLIKSLEDDGGEVRLWPGLDFEVSFGPEGSERNWREVLGDREEPDDDSPEALALANQLAGGNPFGTEVDEDEEEAPTDQLPGGTADDMPDSDFDSEALRQGAEHESEHTNDPAIAREIAKDHLAEDADYYDKLEQVEGKNLQSCTKRLNRDGANTAHKYGCLMLNLPEATRKQLSDWALENIPDFHLGQGGRELSPHVTVAYGFPSDFDQVEQLAELLRQHGPLVLTLTGLHTFADNKDGTPLVVQVDSSKLHQLRAAVEAHFPLLGNKYPDFKPHATLAYLDCPEPVVAAYAAQALDFLPLAVQVDSATWSGADGTRVEIPFKLLPQLGTKSIQTKDANPRSLRSAGRLVQTTVVNGCSVEKVVSELAYDRWGESGPRLSYHWRVLRDGRLLSVHDSEGEALQAARRQIKSLPEQEPAATGAGSKAQQLLQATSKVPAKALAAAREVVQLVLGKIEQRYGEETLMATLTKILTAESYPDSLYAAPLVALAETYHQRWGQQGDEGGEGAEGDTAYVAAVDEALGEVLGEQPVTPEPKQEQEQAPAEGGEDKPELVDKLSELVLRFLSEHRTLGEQPAQEPATVDQEGQGEQPEIPEVDPELAEYGMVPFRAKSYPSKGRGQPCKQGETAASDGCIPHKETASASGGAEPTESGVATLQTMSPELLDKVLGVARREEPITYRAGIQSEEFTYAPHQWWEVNNLIAQESGVGRMTVQAIIRPTVFQPFNSTWAGTAIPASIERVLGVVRSPFDLQKEIQAKKDAKGMKRQANSDLKANGWTNYLRQPEEDVDKLVAYTYQKTQQVLKAAGITGLKLFRGIEKPRTTEAGNAVESWTADETVAKGFSEAYSGGGGGIVESKVIPAERIFATPATGWGVATQVEVLVLAAPPSTAKEKALDDDGYYEQELKWEWWLKTRRAAPQQRRNGLTPPQLKSLHVWSKAAKDPHPVRHSGPCRPGERADMTGCIPKQGPPKRGFPKRGVREKPNVAHSPEKQKLRNEAHKLVKEMYARLKEGKAPTKTQFKQLGDGLKLLSWETLRSLHDRMVRDDLVMRKRHRVKALLAYAKKMAASQPKPQPTTKPKPVGKKPSPANQAARKRNAVAAKKLPPKAKSAAARFASWAGRLAKTVGRRTVSGSKLAAMSLLKAVGLVKGKTGKGKGKGKKPPKPKGKRPAPATAKPTLPTKIPPGLKKDADAMIDAIDEGLGKKLSDKEKAHLSLNLIAWLMSLIGINLGGKHGR